MKAADTSHSILARPTLVWTSALSHVAILQLSCCKMNANAFGWYYSGTYSTILQLCVRWGNGVNNFSNYFSLLHLCWWENAFMAYPVKEPWCHSKKFAKVISVDIHTKWNGNKLNSSKLNVIEIPNHCDLSCYIPWDIPPLLYPKCSVVMYFW